MVSKDEAERIIDEYLSDVKKTYFQIWDKAIVMTNFNPAKQSPKDIITDFNFHWKKFNEIRKVK